MTRLAKWVVPGLFTASTIALASACSSSDAVDPDPAPDGGHGSDAAADSASDDSGKDDANTQRDGSSDPTDGGDAGAIDPYVEACARIDACAAANTKHIGMNGCYRLLTAAPFVSLLEAKERTELENLNCKLAAKTCTEVRACDSPAADYAIQCQELQGGELCVGNVHVACGFDEATNFAPIAVANCAGNGQVCGATSFSASCGLATCDDSFTATCNGTKLTSCDTLNGVTKEVDCKTANSAVFVNPGGRRTVAYTTCGEDAFESTGCIADGAECTGLSQRCDGTVLETCSMGRLARRDCATVFPAGQGCVQLTNVPDRIDDAYGCGPVDPTCLETDNETCNVATGVIGFCGLVGPKTVDCKALGYAGCRTTTVDGRVTAACFQ